MGVTCQGEDILIHCDGRKEQPALNPKPTILNYQPYNHGNKIDVNRMMMTMIELREQQVGVLECCHKYDINLYSNQESVIVTQTRFFYSRSINFDLGRYLYSQS